MTDKQLKSILVKAGVVHATLTVVFAVCCWIFSAGKASADIVQKSDLDPMKADIAHLREDVSYIRGRIDNSPKGVIVPQ